MESKKEIKQFQEFLLNSWPAKHYYFLNGWILRFTDGITSRANSVFPIRYTGTDDTLDNDIDIVEQAYKAHSLPPVFTMHEFYKPENLEDKLLAREYEMYDHTIALVLDIDEVQSNIINNVFEYTIFNSRIKEISDFLIKFSKFNKEEQAIVQEINQRLIIPNKCYMVVKYDNTVIGTLLAVLVPQGFLYVGDVFVHPDFRRQGVATSMLIMLKDDWGIINGVKTIWLQVENVNTKALDLYRKLGMVRLYDYYYMKCE
ncbi:MAG: GNAT family N-acetyltransferase [Candidatus Lokiarchaeota archaeon]|nr:GNAT family N-acetyltransferase [Candidatus Lokiarchaeota archaeon]